MEGEDKLWVMTARLLSLGTAYNLVGQFHLIKQLYSAQKHPEYLKYKDPPNIQIQNIPQTYRILGARTEGREQVTEATLFLLDPAGLFLFPDWMTILYVLNYLVQLHFVHPRNTGFH